MNILKDSEREYLRSMVSPFYKDVTCVVKHKSSDDISYIRVFINNNSEICPYLCIPYLTDDGIYSGMEYGRKYSLRELGIFK